MQNEDFKGRDEKLEASLIFREVWEKAKSHDGYQSKKERFMKEQKEWDKMQKKIAKTEIKEEDDGEDGMVPQRSKGTKTKIETKIKEEEDE